MNRRPDRTQTRDIASVSDCARHLATVGFAVHRRSSGNWVAQDFDLDSSGTFLMGTIGKVQPHTTLVHDEDDPSWVKARSHTEVGARLGQVAPFAIDVREDRRWTAIGAPGYSVITTMNALAFAITSALREAEINSPPWDIDIVQSRSTVLQWIRSHPRVKRFTRIVKRPNPIRDVSDDIAELNALAAKNKTETFVARRNDQLRLLDVNDNLRDDFSGMLTGADSGYVEIRMEAEATFGKVKFRQEEQNDHVYVSDYEGDLQLGMERVLDAVRDYSEKRAVEG